MATTEPKLRTLRVLLPESENLESRIEVRHFELLSDEPEKLGGGDRGPTPMEWVLAGVASCVNVTIRLVAKEQGLRLGKVSIELEGDIDQRGLFGQADVRPDFLAVRGSIRLDLPQEELAELRALVLGRSPALSLLRHAGVPLELTWEAAPVA